MDSLDLNDYGPINNKGYSYIIVIINNYSMFGWNVSLKNKNYQTKNDSFETFLISSKRSQNLMETDDRKELVNKRYFVFQDKNNNKEYSCYISKGAVSAELFNQTVRNLLEKPASKKGNPNS